MLPVKLDPQPADFPCVPHALLYIAEAGSLSVPALNCTLQQLF
jgi:hypothetical protein